MLCLIREAKKQNSKKSFTLLEVVIAVSVFALVMVVIGVTFNSILDAWRRQRNTIEILEGGRWALDFIVNDLRRATGNVKITGAEKKFDFDIKNPNPPPDKDKVMYQLDAGQSDMRRHWKFPGTSGNPWDDLDIARHVEDVSFDFTDGLFTITLTLKGSGKGTHILRTKVRPRT